jgi:hypothetical protein
MLWNGRGYPGPVAEVLPFLVLAGVLAAVMGALAWMGARVRRRGADGARAVMGPLDEIFHPAAHGIRAEIEIHEQRMVPLPSADDRPDPGPVGEVTNRV